ncbi:hypothetical protein DPMN_179588 [Dreissena polymorpha]|uniref:Uncharacterized protein n=1 Tax=Dreissena polymorpha TaxID=45954 RepID=A0A9D4EES2_DREPO|nr:hypothetical protein DPMN_179588 [Dreissena polymorpha]
MQTNPIILLLQLLDAETEAAMLEQNLQDKEESYQREIERLKEHMEMQRVCE